MMKERLLPVEQIQLFLTPPERHDHHCRRRFLGREPKLELLALFSKPVAALLIGKWCAFQRHRLHGPIPCSAQIATIVRSFGVKTPPLSGDAPASLSLFLRSSEK